MKLFPQKPTSQSFRSYLPMQFQSPRCRSAPQLWVSPEVEDAMQRQSHDQDHHVQERRECAKERLSGAAQMPQPKPSGLGH